MCELRDVCAGVSNPGRQAHRQERGGSTMKQVVGNHAEQLTQALFDPPPPPPVSLSRNVTAMWHRDC